MLHETDMADLTVDLPEHGLKAGDVGTVVLVQPARRLQSRVYDARWRDGSRHFAGGRRGASHRPSRGRARPEHQDQPVGKAHGDSRGSALLKVKREQQSTNNSGFSFNMLFVCGRPNLFGRHQRLSPRYPGPR